jgi:hypothetical protein
MQIHYRRDYGMKHLTVEHTYKIDLTIDLSRIRPPYKAWSGLKLEVNHFHIFSSRAWAGIPFEKRKALDPQSIEFIFYGYPNDVKGYRLIDISSDWLIIEHSVQFKESVSHVPQQPHEDTFTLPPVRDDEHEHAEYCLDESSDS